MSWHLLRPADEGWRCLQCGAPFASLPDLSERRACPNKTRPPAPTLDRMRDACAPSPNPSKTPTRVAQKSDPGGASTPPGRGRQPQEVADVAQDNPPKDREPLHVSEVLRSVLDELERRQTPKAS